MKGGTQDEGHQGDGLDIVPDAVDRSPARPSRPECGGGTANCAYDDYYCVYEPPPARPLVLSIAAALNRDTVAMNEELALSVQIANTGGAGAVIEPRLTADPDTFVPTF